MREFRSYGSVRGARSNARPYRDPRFFINIATVAVAAANCGPCAISVAAANAAFTSGVTSGRLSTALEAGLIAGGTAAAFYEVGNLTYGHYDPDTGLYGGQYTPDQYVQTEYFYEKIAGHAAVGCVSAAASGGDCGPQALAAGLSAAAGPKLVSLNEAEGLVVESTIGGVSSVAGGGKFENGAQTAAFGYLFNSAAGRVAGTIAGAVAGEALGLGALRTL